MPVLIQSCIVVATIAVVAIAFVVFRTMLRFDRAATEFSRTLRVIRVKVEDTADDVRGLVSTVETVMPHITSIVTRFENVGEQIGSVGERTVRLSHTVLDEIEAPIRTAAALVNGIRSGSSRLMRAIQNRAGHRQASSNGGIGT